MQVNENQSERLMRSPLFYAQTILRLSAEMYQQAKQADWSMFSELEEKRQNGINMLFTHPQIDAELDSLAIILRKVMLIDAKSIALGEKEKHRLGRKMSGFKQHRQAAQVYQLVSMN